MAARSAASRGLFQEAVRAVLGSWPVLQIAVENCFGGPYVQEKAEWMVGAVDQYFHTNSDLDQYEVEETLQAILNDEFDTVVEDGSLPQIAQLLCSLYSQCQRGDTAAVQQKIAELSQKKYNVKANVQEVKPPEDEEESSDDDEEEAMDCETSTNSSSAVPNASSTPSTSEAGGHSRGPQELEQEPDGWTVVRRKKK
ncbi:PREDICTED: pre-rRNA-processing protein TSR2 homolog isoform X1 [Nanorana parkeri]|uniref:pre-rRNA-processing protein TSR2 homolog isoform X1 n=1 Tax=Nanorana parkeri TaxID=125878 RepID=UPI00085507CE|nr:PREDICTED: pre-rRNA-processing protein TSR2 homolog isoform X1 [Nanorana parkeri]